MANSSANSRNVGPPTVDYYREIYNELNPGIIKDRDSSTIIVQKCSEEFLDAIIADIECIRDEYVLNYQKISRDDVKVRLTAILKECTRLGDNPNLFSSQLDYIEFFARIYETITHINDAIKAWEFYYGKLDEWMTEIQQSRLQVSRPNYKPHLINAPWKQFLDNGAPGVFKNGPRPGKSLQFFPASARNLLINWNSETKAILDYFEATRPERASIPMGTNSAMSQSALVPKYRMKCQPVLEETQKMEDGVLRRVTTWRMTRNHFEPRLNPAEDYVGKMPATIASYRLAKWDRERPNVMEVPYRCWTIEKSRRPTPAVLPKTRNDSNAGSGGTANTVNSAADTEA